MSKDAIQISEKIVCGLGWSNRLASQNGDLFLYEGNKYVRVPFSDIVREIVIWLKTSKNFSELNYKNIQDIASLIIAQSPSPKHNIYQLRDVSRSHIPLSNVMLELTRSEKYLHLKTVNHSREFFNLHSLNFEYKPKAGCKHFIAFLKSVLNNEEILLLQEWFGYQLIPSNLAHKMMIMLGQGANGKSVICLVLRLLLGENNVSSVPLSAFLPNSRFSLAQTEGKLANIIEEVDELSTVLTASLKQYVSGNEMTIERKFRDAFRMKPTARITVTTNTFPSFKDKSDGIWRRLLALNFTRQFLDESEQNKCLSDPAYWLSIDEMSGIFNWSLKGLKRLSNNDWTFTAPPSMTSLLNNYRMDLNPEQQFIKDYLKESPEGSLGSMDVYTNYTKFCNDNGFYRKNHIYFSKELLKTLKHVRVSPHPQRINGIRTRIMKGVAWAD